jgi:hypothetical protein
VCVIVCVSARMDRHVISSLVISQYKPVCACARPRGHARAGTNASRKEHAQHKHSTYAVVAGLRFRFRVEV